MSYEIVYQRQFVRCGDKYIPLCLYGSNNCSYINPCTGREKADKQWDYFMIGSKFLRNPFILLTEEEIMQAVNASVAAHKASGGEDYWLFKFHNRGIKYSELAGFYERGIKAAVTLEEITAQTYHEGIGAVIGFDSDTKEYVRSCKERLTSSAQLEDWADKAEAEAKSYIEKGFKDVYIQFTFQTRNKLNVKTEKQIDKPCIAKLTGANLSGSNYLSKIKYNSSGVCAGFTSSSNLDDAIIFENSENLYSTVKACNFKKFNITVTPILVKTAKDAANRKHFYISAEDRWGQNYIIKKLTPKHVMFTQNPKEARTFTSEAEALKWFEEHITGRFALKNPIVECI